MDKIFEYMITILDITKETYENMIGMKIFTGDAHNPLNSMIQRKFHPEKAKDEKINLKEEKTNRQVRKRKFITINTTSRKGLTIFLEEIFMELMIAVYEKVEKTEEKVEINDINDVIIIDPRYKYPFGFSLIEYIQLCFQQKRGYVDIMIKNGNRRIDCYSIQSY